jgi:hypothetical protein
VLWRDSDDFRIEAPLPFESSNPIRPHVIIRRLV